MNDCAMGTGGGCNTADGESSSMICCAVAVGIGWEEVGVALEAAGLGWEDDGSAAAFIVPRDRGVVMVFGVDSCEGDDSASMVSYAIAAGVGWEDDRSAATSVVSCSVGRSFVSLIEDLQEKYQGEHFQA